MDKYKIFIRRICSFLGDILPIVSLLASFLLFLLIVYDKGFNFEKSDDFISFFLGAIIVILANLLSVFFVRFRQRELYSDSKFQDQNFIKLKKVIEYNKKRKEIEEEIDRLTRELMKSDISQYIDVNRLAFSGQSDNQILGSFNGYNTFLKQFGFDGESVKIKENTAIFLTPFNSEGEELFMKCQTILGKVNIFLQRTDSLVEKDDILMNIVSLIVQSELVLVNIDGRNPNVFYELGISHALGKPTILLSSADYSLDNISFDIRQKRIIFYKDTKELETELLYQINRLKKF